MTSTPILVGLRLGEHYRDRNWAFARRYWEETLGWPVVEGHYYDPGPFSLARASNRAAAGAGDWDVALYVGADFFLKYPRQAVVAVERARATRQLTFAHDVLVQLEDQETSHLIEAQGRVGSIAAVDGHLNPSGIHHRNTFSGVLAVPRALWDEVGGFDERFVGWGYDDIALWCACSAIGGGFQRVPGMMFHLWHPRDRADNEESPEFPANQVLGNRYLAAKGNRAAMLEILAEQRR